jgi:uncharacterized membrane protein
MGKRVIPWLLAASVALNVFFVVVAFRHRPFMHPRPPEMHAVASALIGNLSADDAAIVEKSFAAHKAELEQAMGDNQAFEDQVRAALTAAPFDAAALKAAFDKVHDLHVVMDNAMAASFVDAAAKMSPEGRAKLAAGRHGGGMRRHPFPPPPPGEGMPPPPPPPPNN